MTGPTGCVLHLLLLYFFFLRLLLLPLLVFCVCVEARGFGWLAPVVWSHTRSNQYSVCRVFFSPFFLPPLIIKLSEFLVVFFYGEHRLPSSVRVPSRYFFIVGVAATGLIFLPKNIRFRCCLICEILRRNWNKSNRIVSTSPGVSGQAWRQLEEYFSTFFFHWPCSCFFSSLCFTNCGAAGVSVTLTALVVFLFVPCDHWARNFVFFSRGIWSDFVRVPSAQVPHLDQVSGRWFFSFCPHSLSVSGCLSFFYFEWSSFADCFTWRCAEISPDSGGWRDGGPPRYPHTRSVRVGARRLASHPVGQ